MDKARLKAKCEELRPELKKVFIGPIERSGFLTEIAAWTDEQASEKTPRLASVEVDMPFVSDCFGSNADCTYLTRKLDELILKLSKKGIIDTSETA